MVKNASFILFVRADGRKGYVYGAPHISHEKFFFFFFVTLYRELPCNVRSAPADMDERVREEVKNGDLAGLRVALFSSSTARRVHTLQEIRDSNGSFKC